MGAGESMQWESRDLPLARILTPSQAPSITRVLCCLWTSHFPALYVRNVAAPTAPQ